jgi:hypothetical protein
MACWGALTLAPALAQQAQPALKQPYGGGTPLDVILHTKLWTDVPQMKPFVRASRPPEASLDYTPTTGSEPKRPPLLTKSELQQMDDQLENAGARNEKMARSKKHYFQAVAVKKPKTP